MQVPALTAVQPTASSEATPFARPLLADPNQLTSCERRLTPAHLAARWGHPSALRVLQGAGGDLQRQCGRRGWTPLQEAEEWRRAACVELLWQLEGVGGAEGTTAAVEQ